MSAYKMGYAGQHNRVPAAEPAYLLVTSAAEAAGVPIGVYAVQQAEQARINTAIRNGEVEAAAVQTEAVAAAQISVAAQVELTGAYAAA